MDRDWFDLLLSHSNLINDDDALSRFDEMSDFLSDNIGVETSNQMLLQSPLTDIISSDQIESELGGMVGNPATDAMYYHAQTYSDTCAVVAQQGILKEFNIELTETQLREIAQKSGWYNPGGGTPINEVGSLLEDFGVGVHQVSEANIHDLIRELQLGHKVIVGLDANEIWEPNENMNPLNWWRSELPDAGHAIWLTGIDLDEGLVYMNDSGVPDGQAKAVSIPDFLNAWEDFGNFYCATNISPD